MVDKRFFRRCYQHSQSRSKPGKLSLEPDKLNKAPTINLACEDSDNKSDDDLSDSISLFSDTDSAISKYSQEYLAYSEDADGDSRSCEAFHQIKQMELEKFTT